MTSAWPWLAVAGMGALHGLNPATGWIAAAACGLRSGDRRQAWRALVPIAIGHAGSVALVAAGVSLGVTGDRTTLALVAGALAVGLGIVHRACRASTRLRASSGGTALALWSFGVASMHGAGMMLVPALVPLCVAASPAREITASGSVALALAAVAVHMAAMLGVTAAIAGVACRGAEGWLRRSAARRVLSRARGRG